MKKKLLALFFLMTMFFACKKPPFQESDPWTCPTNFDMVHWEQFAGLGDWQFSIYGHDGDIGIPTGGAPVFNIRTHCGWNYFDHHDGGYNDIYQVIPADTSMRFTWENNLLHQIELFPKWQGCTEHGAKMGDTLNDFLQKQPGFSVTVDSTIYRYTDNVKVIVTAEFTDKHPNVGRLKKIHLISLL